MAKIGTKRLGFFTRILDHTGAAERYRLATEQIVHAERCRFDSAWVAQHHFDEGEGGLPAPFVFLAHVAARTSSIRLGTGIVTLPLENPLRVAEDAVVLDLISEGRLELGLGSGGTPSAFPAFGHDSADGPAIFERHARIVREALAGKPLAGEKVLYPLAPQLLDCIWQAAFTADGGRRAGLSGDGLMLSRTQPRPRDAPGAALAELQNPIIDAYCAALPKNRKPRIMASRTLFVADDRRDALRFAEAGLSRAVDRFVAAGHAPPGRSLPELVAAFDAHLGEPEDVVGTLLSDAVLARATDVVFQVHSVDPPHPFILRSIELIADKVAPALGWAAFDSSPRTAAGAPG
jgi:putative FMN-dependent luciferase-like monooxygenase